MELLGEGVQSEKGAGTSVFKDLAEGFQGGRTTGIYEVLALKRREALQREGWSSKMEDDVKVKPSKTTRC